MNQAQSNTLGALWMVGSALAFTAMGLLIKFSGATLSPYQIAFFRCLFGLVALLPFFGQLRWSAFRTSRPDLHILRLCVGVTAMFCMFYSLTALPYATAISISFARPLFLVLLAVLVLGETVGWRRGLATVTGFVGVLVIMRPGAEGWNWDMLVALAAALLIAAAMVIIKKLSRSDPPITILLWFSIATTIATAGPAYLVWIWPDPTLLAALVLVGAFGTLGQYMGVKALAAGDASAIAPFEFSQILFACLGGLLFFSEVPDLPTILGAAIIMAAVLYILWRETQIKKAGS
ncbi:MAG: DMT family transporter [Rhodospirillaceae bacterium]